MPSSLALSALPSRSGCRDALGFVAVGVVAVGFVGVATARVVDVVLGEVLLETLVMVCSIGKEHRRVPDLFTETSKAPTP